MNLKKLSVVMPVFNEQETIRLCLKNVLVADTLGIPKEVIVIDDGSTDGTWEELRKVKDKRIKLVRLKENMGKGAALRAGMKNVTGDAIVIQDADLEYNPKDYRDLLDPILHHGADVVFGSRFAGQKAHRVLYFWHMLGNKLLTLLSNMMTNLTLTDMETGYKAFTKKVADNLIIEENRFGFEVEFTAKIAKMNYCVFEVGIGYDGRRYEQGKKINWKDGVWALICILKYNLRNG